MASELKVNKISPESGLTLTLGDTGDTINFGSGVLPNFENLTVTGDLTVDTNSLKVDSTNNFVGIGTATPAVALDVVGAITATGNITGTLATAAQPNITSLGTLTGLTTTGDINFGNNDKANFGAGNQLQIYSNGNDSFINESGGGSLKIQGQDIVFTNAADTEAYARFYTNGKASLYFDNSVKFETTSTGIDVTGTVVSDGLTVSLGDALDFNSGSGEKIYSQASGYVDLEARSGIRFYGDSNNNGASTNPEFEVFTGGTAGSATNKKFEIQKGGDISFYEDTGTTAKFFWDASAENLGIGTTSPQGILHLSTSSPLIQIDDTDVVNLSHRIDCNSPDGLIKYHCDFNSAGTSSRQHRFTVGGTSNTKMVIDGTGVGIGTSSPNELLHLAASSGATLRIESTTTGATTGDIFGAIEFETQDANSPGIKGKIDSYSEGTVGNASLRFFTGDTVSLDEAMRIDSSGRVGIGTSSPGAKLNVLTTHTSTDITAANSNSTLILANSGTGNGVYNAIKFAGNQQDMYIMSLNNNNQNSRRIGFFVGTVAGDAIADERLSIMGSGNVGIGTTGPTQKLDVNGTVKATAFSSTGLVVQYVVTKLTGQRSWSHSAYDEWHYVMEQAITPKLSTSTLYCRIVLGGYEHSSASGRGHIKLYQNSSSAGRTFGYNYGGIGNVPGTQIGQNILAQDSNGTSGVITTNAVGSVSNTTGATKYFIFVAAQQDISSGNIYINRWNENETYIEAWEVA